MLRSIGLLTSVEALTQSHTLKQKNLNYDKYSYLADRSWNLKGSDLQKSALEQVFEMATGTQLWDKTTDFERRVQAMFFDPEHGLLAHAHEEPHKLKQTVQHRLDWGGAIPMFIGEIVMGERQTVIDVVYDTGSDWLVIPDSQCLTCLGQRFDNSNSTVVDPVLSQRLYGSAALEGTTYSTKVCLDKSEASCAPDFEYFSFTN